MDRRKIIVVGATGEIGSTLARDLDARDFDLVLVARNRQKLKELVTSLSSKNHAIETMDFNDGLEHIEVKIAEIARNHPNVSSLIYAAGTITVIPFMQTTPKQWTESLENNLIAAVECVKGFVRGSSSKIENRSVVLMSSVASVGGQLGLSTYAAAKAALDSMTKSAARELSRKRVRINSIQFGLLDTGLGRVIEERVGAENFANLTSDYPLGLGEASDASNAALFLISEEAKWITGSNLVVDGGLLTH